MGLFISAWNNAEDGINTLPLHCESLQERGKQLIQVAKEFIKI